MWHVPHFSSRAFVNPLASKNRIWRKSSISLLVARKREENSCSNGILAVKIADIPLSQLGTHLISRFEKLQHISMRID